MDGTLRIAVVTDIHHGRSSLTKRGDRALPLLEEFAEFVATESPDVVVDLGDRITDADRDSDRALLADVAAVFARLDVHRIHVLGNHDVRYLTVDDNEEILGHPARSYSLDVGGWHVVAWQADVTMGADHLPTLTDDDLAWLEADLAAADGRAIVCTHVPLDAASMTSNFYYDANPEYATYANVADAQRVIAAAGNVAMCIAGHVHWNHLSRIAGVPFVTVQSLSEGFTTGGEAAASWALLELGDDLRWTGVGNDPIEVRTPLGGARWTDPLPPFAELRARR